MSVDAFPIVPADEVAMSILCHNSLTDTDVTIAQAALRDLAPTWSLACCESCEADWFLDLSTARPLGRFDQFIIHARDGAIHVFGMAGDDHVRLGRFADIGQAAQAVVAEIGADGA